MEISILVLGFLIGMRHALEADHVAAVASLATQCSSVADTVRHGISWGLGHTITLFLFGSIALLMDSVIPENYAAGLEFAVGIMLILLGLDVLRRLYKKQIHFHTHKHDGGVKHFHAHAHERSKTHSPSAHQHVHPPKLPRRALMIGLIHGMAGSAALILLTVNTTGSILTGVLYMCLFGMGSIGGMALLSFAIAIPLRRSQHGLSWVYNGLQVLVGVATIVVGSMTCYSYLVV